MAKKHSPKQIQLTYATINDEAFVKALDKLDNHQGFSIHQIHRFNDFKRAIDSEVSKARQLYQQVLERSKQSGLTGPDMKFALDRDIQELLKITFKVMSPGLTTEDVLEVGFTPKEVRAIYPILEDKDGVSRA